MAQSKNTHKTVKVKIPRDRTGNADPRGEYIAFNGKGMFIPRGVEVEIPQGYYEAYMISVQAQDMADDYMDIQVRKSKTDMSAEQ